VKAHPPKEFALMIPRLADEDARRREMTVEELFRLPGSGKTEDPVTSGRLVLLREDGEMREFKINLLAKKKAEEIWVYQPRGGYAIALGCPSYARHTVGDLLSYSIYGKLGGFLSPRFEREEMEQILRHVWELGGKLREIHLRRVPDNRISIYHVTGTDILSMKEKIGDPLRLMKEAKKIKRLGFSISPGVISDSSFHLWVADWGGGTLYDPLDPLPHHLVALAEFFRNALANIYP